MPDATGAVVRELTNPQSYIAGIHYLRANMMVFGAILFDLVIVLFGSVIALLPIYAVIF